MPTNIYPIPNPIVATRASTNKQAVNGETIMQPISTNIIKRNF
jgi:hypothetical protein